MTHDAALLLALTSAPNCFVKNKYWLLWLTIHSIKNSLSVFNFSSGLLWWPIATLSSSLNSQLEFKHEFEFEFDFMCSLYFLGLA